MGNPPSVWPGSDDSFNVQEAKKDIAASSVINLIQNAIAAMQVNIGNDVQGTRDDLLSRLAIALATNGAFAQGTSFPVSPAPVEGQPFYRTDENTFYIYDGSDWTAITTHGVELFTQDGVFTVPGGVTNTFLTMVGSGAGGGGGESSGEGGGGGGGETLLNYRFSVTPAAGITVTVGAAGTGGSGTDDGTDGGDVVFDDGSNPVTADGGNKGTGGQNGLGGDGGGTGLDAAGNTPGGDGIKGGDGADFVSASNSGGGGGTPFGKGGAGGPASHEGGNATGHGAGGGGGATGSGGDGSKGFCMVIF